MKKPLNDDMPLYGGFSDNSSADANLQLAKINQERRKFDKLISISGKTITLIIVSLIVSLIVDVVFQLNKLDDSIVKDVISIFKYALSSALGYVFANKADS